MNEVRNTGGSACVHTHAIYGY